MAKMRLILDPALDITTEEFVRHWEADREMTQLANARLEPAPRADFSDASWIAVLTGVALGVPSNAIWDAIKHSYARLAASRRREPAETEFVHMKQPDGTEITMLRIKR